MNKTISIYFSIFVFNFNPTRTPHLRGREDLKSILFVSDEIVYRVVFCMQHTPVLFKPTTTSTPPPNKPPTCFPNRNKNRQAK